MIGWLLTAVTAAGLGQSPTDLKKLVAQIHEARADAKAAREKADVAALRRFDELIARVRSGRGPADARLRKIDELKAARKKLADDRAWDDSDDVLPIRVAHAVAVHKARVPVIKAFRQAIAAASKAGDDELTKRLLADKAAFDREEPGQEKVQPGSRWVGTRNDGNANVPIVFQVEKRNETLIEGEMVQNPREPHPATFKVSGVIEGNYITFRTSRMVAREARLLTYEGVIVGDRIIGVIGGVNTRGLPVNGRIRLELRR